MKGLSSSRAHHQVVSYEPSYDALGHHMDRKPFLISQMDMPVPVQIPNPSEMSYYNPQHGAYPSESNSIVPYGTFPRRCHSTSSSHHADSKDESMAIVPYIGGGGGGGGGYGGKTPTRVPANYEFERQSSFSRDGYHTLQYKRGLVAPGRIRHLVHSVQKLFTKSHSLEGPHHTPSVKGPSNGTVTSTPGGAGGRHRKRSKSRERCRSAEPKHRARYPGQPPPPDLGYPHTPLTASQSQQYFGMMDPYGTLNEHQPLTHSHSHHGHPHVSHSTGALMQLSLADSREKKGAWSSSLTVSRAREVHHSSRAPSPAAGNLNLDRALVKAQASQQPHFLQVPQDDWGGFCPLVKEDDIPCRRMRSGSYVKAMAEDDSGDSDGSPKPSPKVQARRASYLKATQPSLTEMTTLQISTEHSPKLQIRSHSYLRAVSEVSINRSVDTLDPKALLDPKCLLSSPQYRSRNESYMRAMSTISQVCPERSRRCPDVLSPYAVLEPMDTLPMPGCFRMRSHSYVRAIDQGCASEHEGEGGRPLLLLPASPPRTTATTVRTIQSSTVDKKGNYIVRRNNTRSNSASAH
uniref:Discs, large (Drosophila) homolog-associated protein 1a n=1 Tax=Neogobius melanostomus TaxID=47308 RepID=A0A8C6WFV7_9GOBI